MRGVWWLLISAAIVATLSVVLRPNAPVAAQPSPVPTAATCADARERVQQYKAPGAQYTVREAVQASIVTERRPLRVDGWLPADAARSNKCYVSLQIMLANESRSLTWILDTQTGRVEAMDDLTKQWSGWR